MLNIVPKISKSRSKAGHAPWCVDSRYVLKNGTRKFFWTKQDALQFIDKLEAEASPAADSTDTWKWTFADLWKKYEEHLEDEKKIGEISEGGHRIKQRHATEHLALIVDGEPSSKMCVADLTKCKVQHQSVDQLWVGRTPKNVHNHLTTLWGM